MIVPCWVNTTQKVPMVFKVPRFWKWSGSGCASPWLVCIRACESEMLPVCGFSLATEIFVAVLSERKASEVVTDVILQQHTGVYPWQERKEGYKTEAVGVGGSGETEGMSRQGLVTLNYVKPSANTICSKGGGGGSLYVGQRDAVSYQAEHCWSSAAIPAGIYCTVTVLQWWCNNICPTFQRDLFGPAVWWKCELDMQINTHNHNWELPSKTSVQLGAVGNNSWPFFQS